MSSWEEYKKNKYKQREENKKLYEQREIKNQVDSLYKRNETKPTNTWDKVVTRANQIYQDTTAMNSRYGVTQNQGNALLDKVKTTQTKPITEVKGGKKVDEAEVKYELNKIKKEEQQQERLKNIPEGNLPAKAVTVVGNAIQDIAQKPKAFYDGFDLTDIPKAVASTAASVGSHIVGGVEQVGNAIAQGFGYGMATIDKALGKEEKAQAWIKATQQAEQEREDVRKKVFDIFDKNSVLGETSNQVAEGYGQSLTFGTVGQANKIAGDALVATQGFASGLQEAYTEEEVEAWQALMKGTGGAIISYLSENMFDNLGYGGTKVSDAIENKITRGIEKGFGKALARVGYKATGESLEEVSEVIGTAGLNWIINQVTEQVGHGAKFDSSVNVEELVENAVIGFFSGGFGEGSSTFVQNSALSNQEIARVEKETGKELTTEEKQKIKEQTLYNTQTQRENEIIVDNSKLSDEMKQNIKDISQKYNLSNADVESMIKRASETQNQGATMENKVISKQEQQTTLPQGKIAENQTSKQPLGNDKYAIKMPDSNFKFEKTGNQNEDILDESMSKYFNNSEDTKKLNKTLKQIMKDKNLSVRFDDTITDESGNILDGKYENEVITINPNSTKAFEYVATHELTHAIGTKGMLDMVENYRESNSEFNDKVETLLKNYNKSELTEEALADVSAELFGTQEFINDVKNKNPNLFQKIYNEIKYLWHQFRGYKNQNEFIEDLYNKWTAAYNSKEELNQTTKKLFAGTNAKNKNITTLKEALKLEEQGKNEDEIFKETGWFRGNDTKWRFETDDSKISFKDDIELEENEVYYLEEFLNADEIFEAYPELKDDVLIRFKDYDDNRVRGERTKRKALDYEYDEIHINNDVLKDKKELKSVLLHEIQHYIQGKEDFSRGASREYWQEKINDAKRKRDNILKDMEYYHKEIGYDKYKDELFKKADNKEIDFFDVANLLKKYENNSEHSTILKVLRKAYEEANVEYSRLELQGAENLYRNTAGEQESREVQKRVDLTEEERRNELPFITDEKTVYSDADKVYNIAKGGDKDAILSDRRSILSTDTDAKDENTRNRRDNRNINQDEQDRRILQDNKGQDKQGNNEGRNIKNNRGLEGLEESSSFLMQDNKGRKLSKEQQEYFKDSKVRDENGNLQVVYHMTNANFTKIDFKKNAQGLFWFASSKEDLQTGSVSANGTRDKSNSKIMELYVNMKNPANWEQYDKYTIEQLKSKGFDGVLLDEGDGTFVGFVFNNSNQIKNVDNTNPTDNPDIRYSKQNAEWYDYVQDTFKTEGTRTTKEQIRLPEKNVLQENVAKNLSKVTTEEFQRYKRKIIEGKQKEINNLIQIKNQTLTEIQSKIDIKEAQLNNLKKPNSITAQKIKAQIEALKERYNRTENEYLQRIDRRNQRVTRALIEVETKRALKRTRKQVQKALLEQAKIEEVNLDDAKNISTLNMNRTDPIRLQEKVFGKEVGDKINEMFFNKVKHNTAEKTRFLNRERDSIKKWDIKPRSKESEILQKYTEKSFVNAEGKEIEYTDSDLIKDIQDEKTRNKIIKASQELRAKYDNYIDTANDILVDLGYSPIPKRKDYVRHFTELNDIFSKYGVPGKLNDSLPTDINGLTEGFRPGKNFFANAQKRLGNKTTYDAITGIDGYLEGISNLIYHTEDIQRLRAFDKFIRDTYGQNGLENFDKLSDTEKNKRIELISNNHLSEYAKWLTEYTNNLAGKNSVFDRSVEGFLGRKVYSALNAIKKQTGSNMTGFNLGSALTNFVSVAQGASKTKKIALFKGLVSSIQNIAVKDDFIERSDFLTNRFGSDSISKKAWDKASNAGQVFMSATDYLSSNIVVRSKYYEQIAKGKTEEEAMKIADDFGARILGDRSQGAVANIFNSKMLGIVTQFQLEVNNQFDTFIHDTKLDYQETTQKEGALKASMGAVWTLGQLAVYQHIFNELFEKINGNRPAFDVIEIVKTALGIDDEEDEEDDIKGNLQEAVVMLVESVPFINLFSENARIPITSAVPNILSVATGESTLKKEASKLLYLLPPTGGGQLKKTAEGIKTVVEGGSYFINSKGEKELRFPVENVGAKDYLKAGVFGKYALPLAKEYVDKDYKRLSAKATELYDNSTIEFRKLNEFLDYSKQKEIKKKDKISYINNMDLTTDQKWDLYKYDIISDTERKDGTSQLSDADYILKNNMATKSEYMKLYTEAEKNNVEFPSTETIKELKEVDLDLETYMKYKTALTIANREKKAKAEEQEKRMLPIKEEDKLSKSLNEDEMIDLIKDYSIGDKKKIYENYIGKDDTTYSNLKILTGDKVKIEDYLDYKIADLDSDRKNDGTKKGKAIPGSAEKKLVNFLNNSKLSNIERIYIYGQTYELDNSQRQQLQNYIRKLNLPYAEEKELWLDLSSSNVVEMSNGNIEWK